jgi:hypothetical protein
MRSNAIGDSWTYNVTTTLPIIGNGSGTYTSALSADSYHNQPTVQSSVTYNLNYPNGPITLGSYSESTLAGVLVAEISHGLLTAVKSETFHFPSTFTSTLQTSGVLTLADGTIVKQHIQVVGTQQVTVPAGSFPCWVVQEKDVRNDGTTDNYTLYMAPAVGNWVKGDAEIDYSDGTQFDWHAQMTSQVTVAQGSTNI